LSQILKPKKDYKRVTLLPKHIIINIPKEWKIEIMENILIEKIQNGINIKLENYGKGFPIFEIESLYKSDLVIKQSDLRLVSIENMKGYEQYKLKENDFVINRVSKVREGVGKCLLVVNPIKNLLYEGNMIRIRIDNKQMNPMFLAFLTKSNLYFKYIQSTCKTTSLTSIDQGIIEKIPILIPPLQEQQKIASILSNIDNLITNTQKIITQTKSLKEGLIQKLLTRGIDHTEFKKVKGVFGKEIEIPEEWEMKKLGSIITLQRGHDLPVQERKKGKVPVMGSNGIVGFHDKMTTRGNGVVMGRSGTIGKVYYVETDYWALNTTLYVKKFFSSYPKFVYFLLQTINYEQFNAGTSVPTLNRNYLHPMKIPFPKKKSEQQKIASILSNVDSQIQSQTQYKEKLERLKKSLMQKLLTGEVRVKP